MGVGRTLIKAQKVRPKKSGVSRRRREKVHRQRLIELGLDEKKVAKMNAPDMRRILRHPAKVKAQK